MKAVQDHRQQTLALVCFLILCIGIPVLIHRGIHGKYGIGKHGLSIFFLGLLPFIAVFVTRLRYRQIKHSTRASLTVATLLSTCLIIYYLSSNGLWCEQHPSTTRAMCSKLNEFAAFAKSSNVTEWWLTFGDLLAIQRGRDMPLPWDHDIDICITSEQLPIFEAALRSTTISHFYPEPELQGAGHWYIPIDMAKLGLTVRDAEGVNVDIWTCPRLSGNITQVFYCNGFMNLPGSMDDRLNLLTKTYGDYSVVKYSHHETMCRIWNTW